MNDQRLAELQSVSFRYGMKKLLFDKLSLTLETDTIYGLLGKNGAGKTTLLKLMCGLLFPEEGRVEVLGYDPADRDAEMLKEIMFIPEEFEIPAMTIDSYRSIYAPFYPNFDSKAFARYIGEFQLDLSEKLSEMSFGQKKKAVLAFALAANTRVLVLDEPTNALDIPSKGQFRRLLAGAANPDRTIIVSTHQVRDMENLINPIIILEEGRIIFKESMETVEERLAVTQSKEQPSADSVLYSEPAMGGYVNVTERKGSQESGMDLELLFNAVTGNPGAVERIFTKEAVK